MSTDPNGWFLTSQALDHHATVEALDRAVQGQLGEALADDLAAGLARNGYALVQIEGTATTAVVRDLTEAVGAHRLDPSTAPGFLARTED